MLSSPESDAALSPSELLPYYRPRRRRRLPIKGFQFGARGAPHQEGQNQEYDEVLGEEMTSASLLPMERQRPGGPSPRLMVEAVLAATAAGLTCLLGGGGGRRCRGGHHGGNGGLGNGEDGVDAGSGRSGRDGGGEAATELSSSLVSKQTLAACVAEAGRRRLRVDRLLGGGKNSSSSKGGVVWEAEGGPARVRLVTAAMTEGGGGGRREEEEEEL